MPRANRIWAVIFGIGLMAAGCTDPAALTNEIQSVDDVSNTNMPAVVQRGVRTVGNVVLSPVKTVATAAPTPAPTAAPTAAPTPSPSPSGPLVLP